MVWQACAGLCTCLHEAPCMHDTHSTLSWLFAFRARRRPVPSRLRRRRHPLPPAPSRPGEGMHATVESQTYCLRSEACRAFVKMLMGFGTVHADNGNQLLFPHCSLQPEAAAQSQSAAPSAATFAATAEASLAWCLLMASLALCPLISHTDVAAQVEPTHWLKPFLPAPACPQAALTVTTATQVSAGRQLQGVQLASAGFMQRTCVLLSCFGN